MFFHRRQHTQITLYPAVVVVGQEQLDQIKQSEEQRLRQRRMEREAKERERLAELYEDCDDRFAFIAGYTDGGAPFGVAVGEPATTLSLEVFLFYA